MRGRKKRDCLRRGWWDWSLHPRPLHFRAEKGGGEWGWSLHGEKIPVKLGGVVWLWEGASLSQVAGRRASIPVRASVPAMAHGLFVGMPTAWHLASPGESDGWERRRRERPGGEPLHLQRQHCITSAVSWSLNSGATSQSSLTA